MINFRLLFSGIAAVLLASAPAANATLLSSGVNLGAAGETKEWAVLSIGTFTDIEVHGHAFIEGDVGVGGAKRYFRLGGGARLDGDVYLREKGEFRRMNNSTWNGTLHQNAASDALLLQAAFDAKNASMQAFAKPASPGFAGITSIRTNKSLTLNNNGSDVVLRLEDFKLSGNATLTLVGTANSSFVFNVTKQFSISNAQIVLEGGLTTDNVLFNIVGKGGTGKSGSRVSVHNATINGIILAPDRDISITNSTVIGSVIGGGKKIDINVSRIQRPPKVSP